MATIDDKVVAMSFESSKFESGVHNTIGAIDKLKGALKFDNAGKGFDDISKAASRVDLSHIANSVDGIKGKFSALSVAGLAVIAELAQKAVAAGAKFVSAFTLDPTKAGFKEYSTNLNAVQTILANTQASGATLQDVNDALLDLNKYSDKTIYNFGQMARNIGTFTAAGVDLDTSTQAIKGIANLAALSGSNADQASTAMYQLSQAISSGRVGLQDWNSVVNAGMGGTVFQRALATTAENMGKIKKGALKLVGPMKNVSINGESFRQSMQAGPGKQSWLTSDVLTKTLQQFTGDLTDAQLHAQGFNDAQIKAIQQTAKTAQHAATEVKTISQVLDVAKETAGSGWAQTFQIIFGNFGEAKKTFTDLSNTINGFINANSAARNKVLADWKKLGGRTVLIDGIKVAFKNLLEIIKPIQDAFREVFPAKTGKDLFELTQRFHDLAEALKPSPETVDNLKRTFKGLFSLLDIGKQIVHGIFTMFGSLFDSVGGGQGGFLSFTATIGDFLTKLDEALKKSGGIEKFFTGLGAILAVPIKLFKELASAIGDIFGGFSPGGFSDQVGGMTKALTPFQKVMEAISKAWHNFIHGFDNTNVLNSIVDGLVKIFTGLGPAISNALGAINWNTVLSLIRTGLFGALVVMFKQFLGKGSFLEQVSGGFAGGIIKNISSSFDSLSGSMKAMQQSLKAKALRDLAIAIALLTASVVALSFIDAENLKKAIVAMGFMFAELLAAMKILDTIGSSKGFIKIPLIAGSMILLATAIDLLVIAVFALSKLSWEELAKGLGAVGALLAGISAATIPLSANSGGMIRASIAIGAIAVSMKILASAMKDFGQMNWTEITKGLASVGGGLVIIAGAAKLMPANMVLTGAGLVAVAYGLKILAGAMAKFGVLDWKVIGKGLVGIGGALVVIAGAMQLMPISMPVTAAGLLLVSKSLGKIADAVDQMGGMSIKTIAKGIGTLAASLGVLAAGLMAMSGTLAGSAALTVAAAGLSLLVPTLIQLGNQSWSKMLKSLEMLAAAFAVLGIAGGLLTPVVPALIGLGAALLLIGGGLALAGAGIFLLSAGLSALAVTGPAGVRVLIDAIIELEKAVPEMAKQFILDILAIVDQLAKTAPKFVEAVIKIIDALLDAIIRSAPKMADAFTALITAALKVLKDNQAKIIKAGFDLLSALLEGIKNNLPGIVKQVGEIIVAFIKALSDKLGDIIKAGADLLVNLLKGIANNIGTVATAVLGVITAFIKAVTDNLKLIAGAGLSILTALLTEIGNHVQEIITAGGNIIINLVTGLGSFAQRLVTAGTNAIIKFIEGVSRNSVRMANAAGQAILNFLNGLTKAVDKYEPQIIEAAGRLGAAIVIGMLKGMAGLAGQVYDKAKEIGKKALHIIAKPWDWGSPSGTMIKLGHAIMEGLAIGLEEGSPRALASAAKVSQGVVDKITPQPKVIQDIGHQVGLGFAKGVDKSKEDINKSYDDLNKMLLDAIKSSGAVITAEQDKIIAQVTSNKVDMTAINESMKLIRVNEDILKKSTDAHNTLTDTLKGEKKDLTDLAVLYEGITTRLDNAKKSLDDARKTRDDAIKGYATQYSTLPDIVTKDAEGNAINQLSTYEDALKHQADAVGAYKTTLDQLRKLGLDDATYQKLLSEGTADQEFATQLLNGGHTAVVGLNKLDTQLQTVSKTLATNAGNNLYQAGVDAAAGLVRGLGSAKQDVKDKMEEIGAAMVKALRKSLGMKSPSREFMEIGILSMEGLALGFTNSAHILQDASDQVAKDALSSMQKSMSDIHGAVLNELDSNPVITPILDLSTVQSQSAALAALTNTVPITAAASFGQASRISSTQSASQVDQIAVAPGGTSVKFEQNNYSPAALTEIEIYRQTKNQLSQLKSALALT